MLNSYGATLAGILCLLEGYSGITQNYLTLIICLTFVTLILSTNKIFEIYFNN